MKARDLLRAVEHYARAKHLTNEQMIQELPDDKLQLAILTAAELLRSLKGEAVRRGIWDDIKMVKVG